MANPLPLHILLGIADDEDDYDFDSHYANPSPTSSPRPSFFWPPPPPPPFFEDEIEQDDLLQFDGAIGFYTDSDNDNDDAVVPPPPPPPLDALGFESDPDLEGDDDGGVDFGLPLCWNCLQLEDHSRRSFGDDDDVGIIDVNMNPSNQRNNRDNDSEWEEVDAVAEGAGRFIQEIVSILDSGGGEEGEGEGLEVIDEEVEEDEGGEAMDTIARAHNWEMLLPVDSFGRNPMDPVDVEDYFVDEGYAYASDHEAYEVFVSDFAAAGLVEANKGGPPASKSAIENLPSVPVKGEDAVGEGLQCAVCKDGLLDGEIARKLPCAHLYHQDCILPWLAIRNTCPLCRLELPTDDAEYEKWKVRRATGEAGPEGESPGRYIGFDILHHAF